jgi:hypothetical protein
MNGEHISQLALLVGSACAIAAVTVVVFGLIAHVVG